MNQGDSPGVGIVGAGLVGCLAALALAKIGFSVTLFEMRPDPRTIDAKDKNLRSINLAVSDRGIRALEQVDKEMAERVLEHILPMTGRMIHDFSGNTESQQYGLFGEAINSIDREYLNEYLLQEVRQMDIRVLFNHKLVSLENLAQSPRMTFSVDGETKTFEFDYVIGADGAYSQFRYQMQKSMRMSFSQRFIDMQYLELYIPPKDGQFQMDDHHLHIWPRKNHMLIALPNEDGSFTSTFFSPWSVIDDITTESEFVNFFHTNFADAAALMGDDQLKRAFKENPRGSLVQIDCSSYNCHRGLIIGDAAHAMVPFYGQGMNCGFEDVSLLMNLIEKNRGDVEEAFSQYSVARRDDLVAICQLAMDNYTEMSTKVVSHMYLMRKKLDYFLGRYGHYLAMTWIPLYSMISFRGDISYSQAVAIENRQQRILRQGQNFGLVALAAYVGFKAVEFFKRN